MFAYISKQMPGIHVFICIIEVAPLLFHVFMSFRSDEEPVDPKKEFEDRCKAPCTRPLKEYQVILVEFSSNLTQYLFVLEFLLYLCHITTVYFIF